MTKYIEREALVKEIDKGIENCYKYPKTSVEALMKLKDEIYKMPVADVAKVNHGKWEMLDAGPDFAETECSECGAKHWFTPEHDFYDFCPHCGAKMERSNKDDSN